MPNAFGCLQAEMDLYHSKRFPPGGCRAARLRRSGRQSRALLDPAYQSSRKHVAASLALIDQPRRHCSRNDSEQVSRYGPSRVHRPDWKSGVQGKSVSVRVDLGGRRILKKKYNIKHEYIELR